MKNLIKNILYTIIIFISFASIIEISARIFYPNAMSFKAIKFHNDPNSPKLFEKDYYLGWKLKKNISVKFCGVYVKTNSFGFRSPELIQSPKIRILFLGDSTTFGWMIPQEKTFSFLTVSKLKKTFKSIDYINCGVPGYTSFHGKILSKKLSNKFHPNIVVVCLSNNEYEHSKTTLNEIYNTKKKISFIAKPLFHSFFFQYLYDKISKKQFKKYTNTPIVPLNEYIVNIKSIVRNFHTSKIIILSPPRNIIFKPLSTGKFTINKISLSLTYQAYNYIKNNNFQKAAKLLKRALKIDKNNYIALHWLGKVYFNKGNIKKAIFLLEKSIAKDPYPMTIPIQYINTLEKLCKQLNIMYINTNKILSLSKKTNLFLDRANPNIEGNKIIAEKLYEKINYLLKE